MSSSETRPQTAVLLAIGDEVLRGEVANSNAAFLSGRLFEAGLELREHIVVSDDPTAIGRTNDAVLYGGTVHLWIEGADDEVAQLAAKLPSSASEAFGTPFGELLKAADGNFYEIDPMLFSPAAATLTSTESGRAHHGGALAPEVLERSFTR